MHLSLRHSGLEGRTFIPAGHPPILFGSRHNNGIFFRIRPLKDHSYEDSALESGMQKLLTHPPSSFLPIMTKIYIYFLLLPLSITACSPAHEAILPDDKPSPATQLMQKLWQTSPLLLTAERQAILDEIQTQADLCPAPYFKTYLNSLDAACESLEQTNTILGCYRAAFDRLSEEIQSEPVAAGEAIIWMLYNMGYVVKTTSTCFGIDIYHRRAEQLAPFLDFLCITHNHQDHYNKELMQAMYNANKPVLSNWFRKESGYAYTSTRDTRYLFGDCTIQTAITDHNNTAEGRNFITVFRIDCGETSGHFTLLHTGDSNYKPTQFANVQGPVDLLIPRYAPNAGTENNIIGPEPGQIQPAYILLSHILELSHDGIEGSRWPLSMALERASQLNSPHTCVPLWGEKLVWSKKTMK
jgi:hypothetical protein